MFTGLVSAIAAELFLSRFPTNRKYQFNLQRRSSNKEFNFLACERVCRFCLTSTIISDVYVVF